MYIFLGNGSKDFIRLSVRFRYETGLKNTHTHTKNTAQLEDIEGNYNLNLILNPNCLLN